MLTLQEQIMSATWGFQEYLWLWKGSENSGAQNEHVDRLTKLVAEICRCAQRLVEDELFVFFDTIAMDLEFLE